MFCYKELMPNSETSDDTGRAAPAYPIGSVDKALRLLLMVSRHPEGIRVAEASHELGVAPSTAHRLFQMFTHFDLAVQDSATKAYRPGPALHGMALPRERFLKQAKPVLTDLVEDTQETVHLSVLEGNHSVTLMTIESPHMLRVGDRTGHAISIRQGAMARCLLMGHSETELRALLSELPDSMTPEQVDAVVARTLADGKRGYAYHDGEVEPDVSVMAVPVLGEQGARPSHPYAISVTFPTARVPKEDLPHVLERLRAASASLGLILHG